MSISKQLAERILAELPSASLRAAIAEKEWKFTDRELFLITAKFCARFGRRRELLKEIEREADKETAERAGACRDYEEKRAERFAEAKENEAYLVKISDRAYEGTMDYVFKSFKNALNVSEIYDGKILRVEIQKVVCGDALLERGSDDDYYQGQCYLDENGEILWIWDNETCDIESEVEDSEVLFPNFLKDYDLVKFKNAYTGREFFGFSLKNDDLSELDCAYIIELNERMERYAFGVSPDFELDTRYFAAYVEEVIFHSHVHIEPPLLEKIGYDELPERWKPVYDKITSEHKELMAERARKKGK